MKKLGLIYDRRLRILRAIPVQESREADGTIVLWNRAILHFGAGNSFGEAAEDFCKSMEDLYWMLKDEQMRLGPVPLKQWKFMRAYMEER